VTSSWSPRQSGIPLKYAPALAAAVLHQELPLPATAATRTCAAVIVGPEPGVMTSLVWWPKARRSPLPEGLVSLEIEGNHASMGPDPELLFEAEVAAILEPHAGEPKSAR